MFLFIQYLFTRVSLFDQFTTCLSYIKHINFIEKQKNQNFVSTWFDGFCFLKEMEAFQKNINWIREQKCWKRIAYCGIFGTTHLPVHIFAIFIDVNQKEAFIYNSQKEKDAFNDLKKQLYEYKFIENNHSTQFKNRLCGFFALNFIEKMMKSTDLHACFAEFDVEKNRDDEIFEYQKKSVFLLNNNVKLLHIFLENWQFN